MFICLCRWAENFDFIQTKKDPILRNYQHMVRFEHWYHFIAYGHSSHHVAQDHSSDKHSSLRCGNNQILEIPFCQQSWVDRYFWVPGLIKGMKIVLDTPTPPGSRCILRLSKGDTVHGKGRWNQIWEFYPNSTKHQSISYTFTVSSHEGIGLHTWEVEPSHPPEGSTAQPGRRHWRIQAPPCGPTRMIPYAMGSPKGSNLRKGGSCDKIV